jgi:hypothetical protein
MTEQRKYHKFKPNGIDITSMIFLIGKRNTGKTVLMKDIAHNIHVNGCKDGKGIDMVVCMSPTEDTQCNFRSFVPYCHLYNSWREDVIESLMETQKRLLMKNQKTNNILIVIDDCAWDQRLFKNPTMRKLCMNGRHLKCMVMLSVQYALDIPTAIRGNIDIVIALRDNTYSNKEKYWRNFFGQFDSLRDFSTTFDALTENYGAIVGVNNNAQTNTITDNIFHYRASLDIPDKFEMGRPVYWALSERFKKDEYANFSASQAPVVKLDDGVSKPKAAVSFAAVTPPLTVGYGPVHVLMPPQQSQSGRGGMLLPVQSQTAASVMQGGMHRGTSSTVIRLSKPTLPMEIRI